MRALLATILIAGLSLAATWFAPWWTLAPVSFLVCFFLRPRRTFLVGFLGVFLLWLAVGLIRDLPNDHVLSARMAGVLPLGGMWWLYLIVSAIIGGLVGGFAGWSGAALRRLFRKKVTEADPRSALA